MYEENLVMPMAKLWRELIFVTENNNKKTEILILLSNDMYL